MNIGFYILDIDQNNARHQTIINTINRLCALRPSDNIVLFNNNFNAVDTEQKYYILSINHAKYFNGLLLLFDTEQALLTKTFPGPEKQLLFMSQPDWGANYGIPFTLWYSIYMDKRFELLAESDDMAQLIETCWKPALSTIHNLEAQELNNVIQKLSK